MTKAKGPQRRKRPPVVVVIDTSPDTVNMLRLVLEHAGFTVLTGYTFDIRDGRFDLVAMMRKHHPQAIVYDIAPPYADNFRLMEHLRTLPDIGDCPFVITSTNAPYVRSLTRVDEPVYEVIGKPYDLKEIVRAVKRSVRVRRR
jgi:CheY-like chemotaxis protein